MTDILVYTEACETNKLLKDVCSKLDSINEKLARLTEDDEDEPETTAFFEPKKK